MNYRWPLNSELWGDWFGVLLRRIFLFSLKDYRRPLYCACLQNYRTERQTWRSVLWFLPKTRISFPRSTPCIFDSVLGGNDSHLEITQPGIFSWYCLPTSPQSQTLRVCTYWWGQVSLFSTTPNHAGISLPTSNSSGDKNGKQRLRQLNSETQGVGLWPGDNWPSKSSSGPELKDLLSWMFHFNHGKAIPFRL